MAAVTLEVHLTVDGCGPQRLAEVLAEVHPAATVTHVELDDSGEHAQLMATWHQPAPLGMRCELVSSWPHTWPRAASSIGG